MFAINCDGVINLQVCRCWDLVALIALSPFEVSQVDVLDSSQTEVLGSVGVTPIEQQDVQLRSVGG